MPLGQGIGETWEAVRDRVQVSGHGPVWQVTAGSFDTALDYARERFGDPVVLERRDRHRLWPRVTLTVTTDAAMAEDAPPLEELARPVVPQQQPRRVTEDLDEMPTSLEAIFAHQDRER